tara:strand:- start:1046 stop:3634 length:2589 start_codon:yes stop_codon:yes gene_type:complete
MKNNFILFLVFVSLLSACKISQKTTNKNVKMLDAIEVLGKKTPYRGSFLQSFDLIHTKLNVSFSWEDQYLFGEAILDLKPYFYPQNVLTLDAKGMDIEEVSLVNADGSKKELKYTYDSKLVNISLDKTYNKSENLAVYIKYIAKPNELENSESVSAISDAKGLFFINPLNETKNKPQQIWTQGEPESNSAWFPTIDHPNERCTQEITITVNNKYIAMSNGYIADNIDNGDGTYTITWKQDKPHAPYLFMMAIGEFAEVKDSWRGMSVNYYVEEEYKAVAKKIFGKTPRMLEFYSNILGVEYQWDKYWQVIVRDYVSGAMENTSAVIFGDFVQRDERELLDENHEDIVAHELFHHWFGDLVTCESWANLPLNESFATYGEVLWDEHEFGVDAKYLKVKKDMDSYFREAKSGKQVNMIRYYYDEPRDMFDSHSYAKGGVILNMLREVVGDDAFFASLQNYLLTNKFQSVEIHNLRLAFEKTTGQDLNWFFNQWFLSAGHPIIDVNYTYTDSSVIVNLKQTPSKEEYLVYTLPMAIDITEASTTRRENIILNKREQSFEFKTNVKPQLVNVDADKFLLAEFKDAKTAENYIEQFNHAKNLIDKLQALAYFADLDSQSLAVKTILSKSLSDEFWYVQKKALSLIDSKDLKEETLAKVIELTETAEKTSVQSEAYYLLAELEDKSHESVFEKGIQSQSYRVNAAALDAMLSVNKTRALALAGSWENIDNYDIIDAVGATYSSHGDISNKKYFETLITNSDDSYAKYYSIYHYSKFLGRMDNKTVLEGVSYIENWGKTDTDSYSKKVSQSALKRISKKYTIKVDSYKSEIKNTSGLTRSQKLSMENEYANLLLVLDRINEANSSLNKK